MLLENKKVDVNACGRRNCTALFMASDCANVDTARDLLSHDKVFDMDCNGNTCLTWAAIYGGIDTIGLLLNYEKIDVPSI